MKHYRRIAKQLRKIYNKIIHSVAFFPAMMGFLFLIIAIISMSLDLKGFGEKINNNIQWLTLKDASTARTIVATVAAGIISLTVFSFSMVMIVMNQAASQMSNRMLGNLINDKLQKRILGIYIGTIVYSLVLLSNISEKEEAHVPTFSIYLLIILTIINIFLFVYFLHHITESFRYEQLIQRIHDQTVKTWKIYLEDKSITDDQINVEGDIIMSVESGYFQGFAKGGLLSFARHNELSIQFLHHKGSFILKGTPFLKTNKTNLQNHVMNEIWEYIDFYNGQEIDNNPYYGFFHLKEVAIKALSPGINDPGTAVLCLHALNDLLAFVMKDSLPSTFGDAHGKFRIKTNEYSFEELFLLTIAPIWDYGSKDRTVQLAMIQMIRQLKLIDLNGKESDLLQNWKEKVEKQLQE